MTTSQLCCASSSNSLLSFLISSDHIFIYPMCLTSNHLILLHKGWSLNLFSYRKLSCWLSKVSIEPTYVAREDTIKMSQQFKALRGKNLPRVLSKAPTTFYLSFYSHRRRDYIFTTKWQVPFRVYSFRIVVELSGQSQLSCWLSYKKSSQHLDTFSSTRFSVAGLR